MSRFFSETRKAQEWSSQQGRTKKMDLARVMEAAEEPLGLLKTSQVVSPTQYRKTRLPLSSEFAILFANNGFANLAAEAYRDLRTRLLRIQEQRGFRSVVISSAVPGEGKTVTTLNLALCCAQLPEQRVLVIDGDLRTGGLTTRLGRLPAPGLGEILMGTASYERAIMLTDTTNLHVLGAGASTASPAALYSGERWKEFITWCAENFSLVLVDSPPIAPLADFEQIAACCDAVLAVVRSHHADAEIVTRAAQTIDPQKLIGVVLNASTSDSSYYGYDYYGSYGKKA
jgi:protein-tyrosine kinase